MTDDPELAELDERLRAVEQALEAMQTELQTARDRDIPLLKGTVRSILDAEIDTIEEFPAAGRAFGERFVERGERLDQLEARLDVLDSHTDASTKAEKFATVLAFAQNKADTTGKVAVTPAEIRGCTGVSRRYAYDLVDALAADVEGVTIRKPQQVQTGTGPKQKQKALLVDCEEVHEVSEAVKEFTTADGGDDGP